MDLNYLDVSLQLDGIDALFEEPEGNPFDPNSRYLSGMDEVRNYLIVQKLDDPVRLTIVLPDTAVNADTTTMVKEAIDRYCMAKFAENQQQIKELRFGGRRSLISAFVIAVVLLVLTIVVTIFANLNDALSGMLAGWIGIAIWVIFWNPIDTYVYAWRPYRREIKIYEAIQQAELIIKTTNNS